MNIFFSASAISSFAAAALLTLGACGSAAAPSESTASSAEALDTPTPPQACASDDDCTDSQFCATEGAGEKCGGAGVCETRGEGNACPYIDMSLCGCDGSVYANSCFAHKVGVSIDPTPFKTESISSHQLADNPWMDQEEVHFYLFTEGAGHNLRGGTFQARTEPACTRATPHCDLEVEPLDGTFTIVGSHVTLAYDNGSVTTFKATRSCTKAWHLTGEDFGASLELVASTIPQ